MRHLFYQIFGKYGWLRYTLPTWVRTLPFRVRHGWDYRDCWNLDHALAEWLGKRLVHLGEVSRGVPYGYCKRYAVGDDDPDYRVAFDIWVHDLKRHGKALEEYADLYHAPPGREGRITQAAKEAIRFVSENLEGLWD